MKNYSGILLLILLSIFCSCGGDESTGPENGNDNYTLIVDAEEDCYDCTVQSIAQIDLPSSGTYTVSASGTPMNGSSEFNAVVLRYVNSSQGITYFKLISDGETKQINVDNDANSVRAFFEDHKKLSDNTGEMELVFEKE